MAYSQERAAVEHAQHPLFLRAPVTEQSQCLVVARDGSRRRWLADAAHDAGWFAFESPDRESALTCHRRMLLGMVVVDLHEVTGSDREELRQLVSLLAKERRLLVAVCGNIGEPAEEIWARQQGVWLYLPGAFEVVEFTTLCGEALEIAKRLAIARASPPAGSSSWRR